ncbi:protein LONGIFOLIA 1-like [Bidens hawaiensis]|uniref:protein LONGIFOLIA 1-like n=1 Tax=Bidens hawaiensis TaxID=980011 RepID=UPI0040495616
MNKTTESPPSSVIILPSPVSVLDSGFDKDESTSPSQSIDFKATSTVDFDEENWSPKISPTEQEEFISDDPDFIYISEILRASQHLRDDSTVFFSIEKQLYNSNTTTAVSKRHRKLIFDVIFEMLDRNRQLPPWKTSIEASRTSVQHIWNELQRIREMVINPGSGDGLVELISSVLKKDLVEVKDWDEYPIDTSEVILDTERLIFKDLVSEVIRDFGEYSGECKLYRSRRKLVF